MAEGLTNEQIKAQGIARLDGGTPPATLPASQRRGDPTGGLSGPKNGAEYNAYFSPEVWRHRVGDDAATKELRKAYDELGESWSKAFGQYLLVKDDPDPRLNAYSKQERINQRCTPPIMKAVEAAEKALAEAEGRVATLREEAAKRLRERGPEAGLDAEIRRHVKELPPDQRHGFVEAAIAAGDMPTLAALFSAPPFLSGLDPARYEHARERTLNQLAPAEAKRVEATVKATALLRQRVADLKVWAGKDFGPPAEPKGPGPRAA